MTSADESGKERVTRKEKEQGTVLLEVRDCEQLTVTSRSYTHAVYA